MGVGGVCVGVQVCGWVGGCGGVCVGVRARVCGCGCVCMCIGMCVLVCYILLQNFQKLLMCVSPSVPSRVNPLSSPVCTFVLQ